MAELKVVMCAMDNFDKVVKNLGIEWGGCLIVVDLFISWPGEKLNNFSSGGNNVGIVERHKTKVVLIVVAKGPNALLRDEEEDVVDF